MVFDKIIDWFLKGYVNAFLSPKLVNIKHFKEIRFECIEDCGDCCKKGMVCVAEKEMQDKDLEEKLKGNLYVLENKYQKGANLIIMREGELIKKTKYGECIFLDKNKCSIYSNKPLVCNSYPISVDPFDNEVYIDMQCKGVGKGKILLEDDIERMTGWRKEFWEMMNLSQSDKVLIHKELFTMHIKK